MEPKRVYRPTFFSISNKNYFTGTIILHLWCHVYSFRKKSIFVGGSMSFSCTGQSFILSVVHAIHFFVSPVYEVFLATPTSCFVFLCTLKSHREAKTSFSQPCTLFNVSPAKLFSLDNILSSLSWSRNRFLFFGAECFCRSSTT